MPVAAVASAFEVSTPSVRKWLARYGSEGVAGLQNRSPAPHLVANKLPAPWLAHDRPAASRVPHDLAASPVAEHCCRPPRPPRPGPAVTPGAERAGGGVTAAHAPAASSTRTSRSSPASATSATASEPALGPAKPDSWGDRRGRNEGAGWELVHVAVDDASRLAYVEVLPDEKRQSVTGFLVRALRWFKREGVRVERVMTDDGSGYVSRLFGKPCRMLRLRPLPTRPYTPKTKGKAERFIQTLLREWAYALPYRSSETRAADLPC